MGSGSACAPNFGCVRGTKPSFFTFARENSGVQPLTKKINGKERTIEEEIFDKSSDQISRLVNKIRLCRYPRYCYLIYDNGSEFKLHFETLCDSCIQRKPTKIKNPKANAICECVHQILGTMMRTSEIDMANSVEPADIDTSIDNTAWAFR